MVYWLIYLTVLSYMNPFIWLLYIHTVHIERNHFVKSEILLSRRALRLQIAPEDPRNKKEEEKTPRIQVKPRSREKKRRRRRKTLWKLEFWREICFSRDRKRERESIRTKRALIVSLAYFLSLCVVCSSSMANQLSLLVVPPSLKLKRACPSLYALSPPLFTLMGCFKKGL